MSAADVLRLVVSYEAIRLCIRALWWVRRWEG